MTVQSADAPAPMKKLYPVAKTGDVIDDYHGTKIADPYRWLEDTNSADTAAWVAAENKVTAAYFAQIPEREKIRARLTQLFDYERFPALALEEYAGAFQAGGKYFVFRNDGLQNQDVLYVLDKPDATRASCSIQTRCARMGLLRSPASLQHPTAPSWHMPSRKRARTGRSGACAT
jgi:hypothetical protein